MAVRRAAHPRHAGGRNAAVRPRSGATRRLRPSACHTSRTARNCWPCLWPAATPSGSRPRASGRSPFSRATGNRVGAGEGEPRVALFFISSRTGQMVKRAAVGAEGYVLDHYDRAAIENHLKNVGDRLMQAFGANPPYAVFSDSLEVYDSDWTPNLLEEFRKRRGYDLTPYLPALVGDIGAQTGAIRHDWGKTLYELAEDNYLRPITRMGAPARHAVPLADLRDSAGDLVEQRAGGPARRRRRAVAAVLARRDGHRRRAICTAGRSLPRRPGRGCIRRCSGPRRWT